MLDDVPVWLDMFASVDGLISSLELDELAVCPSEDDTFV